MTTTTRISKGRVFGNEVRYLEEVIKTDFRTSKGTVMTRRLEELFAKTFETRFAVAHVNGTATMHALLEAWGIGVGDEVIIPPLTMSATAFAVLQANATPVFADVDPDTFQISAPSIEERVTERTRAIITVALYGLSPDMDPIMDIARRHDLRVLEDNAQCFLGRYKGRMVGTIGHAASFSLQSSKHITSGEGGIVITNDAGLAEGVRKVQSLGYAAVSATKGKIAKQDIQDPDYSRHVTMGWNYRMSELCAAVALAQLENIEPLVAKRVEAARILDEAARGCNWLVPQKVGADYTNAYWTYVVQLRHPSVSWHDFRDRFVELGGDGVYAAWKLTYLEPMFEHASLLGREGFISKENLTRYRPGLCPAAEDLQPRLVQFKTSYWDISDAHRQAEVLAATIRSFS